MMKKIMFLSSFVSIATMIGCSDPQLKAEVERLEEKNRALTMEIERLRLTMDSLKVMSDSLHRSLNDLDMTE